ncbi:MAG TPA: BTAD domain-containing putative transcriptional regulator [Xanthobacteraceae bacterium]|nr:BTAD domain-containing putative transcriptional regulator [Xanthobacteraceae bacterium]
MRVAHRHDIGGHSRPVWSCLPAWRIMVVTSLVQTSTTAVLKPSSGDPLNRLAFELRVLGPFELVAQPSGDAVAVPTKMRALLAYLAASPRAAESRRHLAGLLWANRSEERARQSMRQMLSNFRRSQGSEVLLAADDDDLAIDQSLVAVDRAALMAASAQIDVAALSAIADLYRGDFAAGLEIGEPEFDAWLQGERTRCREAAIALLDRLVRALADLGRHDEALRRAIRLTEIDPLREETLRLVMVEEAIVSGRASAMRRYEAFRLLLRDELGIRPEAATLRLLDDLRRPQAVEPAPSIVAGASKEASSKPPPHPQRPRLRWRLWGASTIAAALLIVLAAAAAKWRPDALEEPAHYVDEDTGRASVVLLPFEAASRDDALDARARAYEAEVRLNFARTQRLTVIEPPDPASIHDAVAVGRSLRALYVVRTSLAGGAAASRADITLLYSRTGASVGVSSLELTDPVRFARDMYRDLYVRIVLHRARTLSASDPDSIPGLLWRGAAAQIRTRVGSADPDEFALFNAVLERDPNQLDALLALARGLSLKVARDQSADRDADLERVASLLRRAREQAPNLAEIAFQEGMVNKMRHRYEQSIADFERVSRLDRTAAGAKAQIAHVKMFLGRFEEAYSEMEAISLNLTDIAAAELGYEAGETALVAGHVDRALAYLEAAVTGNANVARVQALYAAALWMDGRQGEAHRAALLTQTLVPPLAPERLRQRGGKEASERYQAARDRYIEAFRNALAAPSTD